MLPPLTMFKESQSAGNELIPNHRFRSGTQRISINRLGFRGPEIQPQKPKGVIRIATLGESSTFGFSVNDGEEWPRLVEQELNNKGLQVEVINAGVPGYNLFHSIARYEEKVASLEVDLVVIYLGWNDLPYIVPIEAKDKGDPFATFRKRPIAPAWERFLYHSTLIGFAKSKLSRARMQLTPFTSQSFEPTPAGLTMFEQNLKELLRAIKLDRSRILLATQLTAASERASPSLANHLAPDPVTQQKLRSLVKAMQDKELAVANEQQIPTVRIDQLVEPTSEHLVDYVHLSVKGEQEVARAISKVLEPTIRNMQTR